MDPTVTETSRTPIELSMARNMVKRAAWIGPALVGLFWLLRGSLGAGSATLGLTVVIANFLLAGALLSYSIRISLSMYHAAALVGFLLRLGLIAGNDVAGGALCRDRQARVRYLGGRRLPVR